MMKNILPLLFVWPLLLFGCKDRHSPNKREFSDFLNTRIEIPTLPHGVYKNRDTAYIHRDDVAVRMVVFYDSTTCSSCQIARIWEWDIVTSFAKTVGDAFQPIFIFAPAREHENETLRALKSQSFNCPIYVDTQQAFLSANKKFPKEKVFHTFLLDKNGKVILVGEPTYNSELWEMYKNTISTLIGNQGVLPSE